jgi:hypothetical protein
MRRLALALALFALVPAARADRIGPIARPVDRALRVPVVVVGKVTAVEKDTVDAAYYKGGAKVAHKVAVVKVETNLFGADATTHLKVGFVPSGTGGVRPGRGPDNPNLKEGDEFLFFLTKSPGGAAFLTIPYMTPPLPADAPKFKEQVADVKGVLALVADPAKALKAEKPEARFAAAVAVLTKYRTRTEGVPYDEFKEEPIAVDESRALLKALAEGKWTPRPAGDEGAHAYAAFAQLGLTDKDGWQYPKAEAGKDFTEQVREAFAKWLDGPGKDYRVKKLVEKK